MPSVQPPINIETSNEFLEAISCLPVEIRRVLRRERTLAVMNGVAQQPRQKWCGECVHFTGQDCSIFVLKRHVDTTACFSHYSIDERDRRPGTQIALFV